MIYIEVVFRHSYVPSPSVDPNRLANSTKSVNPACPSSSHSPEKAPRVSRSSHSGIWFQIAGSRLSIARVSDEVFDVRKCGSRFAKKDRAYLSHADGGWNYQKIPCFGVLPPCGICARLLPKYAGQRAHIFPAKNP